jgi:hypothetical protein
LAGETEVLGEKPAPAPFCPPQIPLDQTRARTRAAAVGTQRLTNCIPLFHVQVKLSFSLHIFLFFFCLGSRKVDSFVILERIIVYNFTYLLKSEFELLRATDYWKWAGCFSVLVLF